MKYLLILLLLICFKSQAQDHWIKISSMSRNGSYDEWVRSASKSKSTPDTIYDTIYLPQKQIDSMSLSKDRVENIQFDTTHFNRLWVEYTPRLVYKKQVLKRSKKKKHYNKTIYYWTKKQACPIDTVRGIISYNIGRDVEQYGNVTDTGCWIGCNPHYVTLSKDPFIFGIPSKYKKFEYYIDELQLKSRITEVSNGIFTDDNFKRIPTSKVYFLLIDINLPNKTNL